MSLDPLYPCFDSALSPYLDTTKLDQAFRSLKENLHLQGYELVRVRPLDVGDMWCSCNPLDYLKITTKNEDRLDIIIETVRDNPAPYYHVPSRPWLFFDGKEIRSHDGRHRAALAHLQGRSFEFLCNFVGRVVVQTAKPEYRDGTFYVEPAARRF